MRTEIAMVSHSPERQVVKNLCLGLSNGVGGGVGMGMGSLIHSTNKY